MAHYPRLSVTPDLEKLVKDYVLPSSLGFGKHVAPLMATCLYTNGEWQQPKIEAYGPMPFVPAAKIFQYGQQVFEGMKAYRQKNGKTVMFRPLENFKRFNLSAARLAMPEIPEELFMGCVESVVHAMKNIIPTGEGESLYLRPFMVATEPGLSISVSSDYLFFVLASPSGSYFSADRVSVMIERVNARAAHGGTGSAKTSGNYAASLTASIMAKKLGYHQTIWLDACEHKYIEEFSGMNFFAVMNNELFTPALGTTILHGITRSSLISLAKHQGIKVNEAKIDIDELISSVRSGDCNEVFACGTAAIVTPVAELGESDGTTRYPIKTPPKEKSVAARLRQQLLAIQTGAAEDHFGWVHPIN
jgi:branched-chain amino acid aminotransferase